MFRTEIHTEPSDQHITHSTPVFTIGSCFSDVIGVRLANSKFKALVNPFGTVYNPASIFKLLDMALHNHPFDAAGIVSSQGVFHHFDLHSSFGAGTENELLEKANNARKQSADMLSQGGWLIITLGTAVVYSVRDTDRIVANCHKVPAASFTKRLLSVKEVIRAYESFRALMQQKAPDLKVILTVSPVRHIKDNLVVNSQSKSILRVAAAEIAASYPEAGYFPSFEIMMDDLRDYRFYEKDMLHPNEVAHDYIWQRFSSTYFNSSTMELVTQWEKLMKNFQHRPFHPESAGHQQFLRNTLRELERLSTQLDLSREIDDLKTRLQ